MGHARLIPALLAVLPLAASAQDPAAVREAVRGGVRLLLDAQLRDGAWGEYQRNGYRNGMTAPALYALLEAGLPRARSA